MKFDFFKFWVHLMVLLCLILAGVGVYKSFEEYKCNRDGTHYRDTGILTGECRSDEHAG